MAPGLREPKHCFADGPVSELQPGGYQLAGFFYSIKLRKWPQPEET